MSQASRCETGNDAQDDEVAGHATEISWVGAQHLMYGFCGRASDAPDATAPATNDAGRPARDAAAAAARTVAVVRTRPRQPRVVRIGPPRSIAASELSRVRAEAA